MYYIGIDLGGTNVAIGIVTQEGKIVDKKSFPTNAGRPCSDLAKEMADTIFALLEKNSLTVDDIKSIGMGSPGSIDKNSGVIIYSNNLHFENEPIKAEIQKYIDKPFYIENDANCAAWAEVMAGAAKGVNDAIMITLGTGVGGGIIANGRLYSGFNFCGGELGHTVLVKDGEPCTCGRKGCWETYSSATALIRMTKCEAEKNKDSKMWNHLKEGRFNGRTAFNAMREGDESAKKVVDEYLNYLATGIANMINIFQPEVFVIGGGVSNEGEPLLAPLRELVPQQTYGGGRIPTTKIVKAIMGNDAGIVGAALLRE